MSRIIDRLSQYLSRRKGLLPLIGTGFVAANLILRVFTPASWLASTDLLLHLGVLIAIFGFLLAAIL